MLTHKERSLRLNKAIELMEQADALIQEALGAGDECYAIHNAIEAVIEDSICALVYVDEGQPV